MRGANESVRTGDRSRSARAKASITARFDARANLALHLALAQTVAKS